jgi:hypothetical protein
VFKLRVENPIDSENDKTFHFGFALVNKNNELLFFRVQDHLRKMGIGGKMIQMLKDKEDINKFSGELVKKLKAEKDKGLSKIVDADLIQFERMCKQAGFSPSPRLTSDDQ